MLNRNKTSIVLALLLILAIVYMGIQALLQPKTGFVIITELYNGFEMKKEMEQKYLGVKNARDKILDSLTLELKLISQKIETEQEKNPNTIKEFTTKRTDYLQRKQAYQADNTALSQKYDQEILTQMNQYVKDYGVANGYTYVFGNDGNGSLMYAKDANNITKQVIAYINSKYKGIK
jgi:outer membrane protein